MTCKYYDFAYEENSLEVISEYCECKDEEIEIDKDCQGCCDFQPE